MSTTLNKGDKVALPLDSGFEYGIVKWIGDLKGAPVNPSAGVVFDNEIGGSKDGGMFGGVMLFVAPINRGKFVPVSSLIKISDLQPSDNESTKRDFEEDDAEACPQSQFIANLVNKTIVSVEKEIEIEKAAEARDMSSSSGGGGRSDMTGNGMNDDLPLFIPIEIADGTSALLYVNAKKSWTLSQLKTEVTSKYKFPKNKQKWFYGQTTLMKDGKTLHDIGLELFPNELHLTIFLSAEQQRLES